MRKLKRFMVSGNTNSPVNLQRNPRLKPYQSKRYRCFRALDGSKKAEIALRESEANYRSLYSAMTEGVCLHEIIYGESGKPVDYIILDINDSYETITGLTREHSIGKKASELYGTGKAPFLDKYACVAESRKSISFEIFWPPMNKHLFISVISPKKGQFATVFTDITERKLTLEALKVSEERFRELARCLPQTIFETDKNGIISFANAAGFEAFGYSKEDLEKGFPVLSMLAPSDRICASTAIAGVMKGTGTQGNEYTAIRKDGSTFPVMIYSTPIYRDDKIIGMRGILIDITVRKKLEYERRQCERLEATQALAHSIGHDFNNLICSILGNAEMNLLLLGDAVKSRFVDKNALDILHSNEDIKNACLRASQLVRQLYGTDTHRALNKEPVNVTHTLKSSARLLISYPGINVGFNFENDLYPVLVDEMQISRVFYNLFQNAAKAIEENGKKGLVEVHAENIIQSDKRYVKISITDNGVGIPQELKELIFEWTFSTRMERGGNGLGLPISRGIILAHGGKMNVESIPGQTTFQVLLPVDESKRDAINQRLRELSKM